MPRRLTELVPEEFSEHWSGTLAFLQIVTQFWPAHLAEHGLVSAVARRKRLMQAAAERLRSAPPEAPVIVAGVTRADPAAARPDPGGDGSAERRSRAAAARSHPR